MSQLKERPLSQLSRLLCSFVRHSRRAETAVDLRLRSDCRTCKPLHGIVGDRTRMATRKGSQVTSDECWEEQGHLRRGSSEEET